MKHWLIFCIHSFPEEYEKLWAAVTGGRGTGRGTKKKIVKGVDPKLLKYGKQIFSLTIGTLYTIFFFFNNYRALYLSIPTCTVLPTPMYMYCSLQIILQNNLLALCLEILITCTCTGVCDPHISGGSWSTAVTCLFFIVFYKTHVPAMQKNLQDNHFKSTCTCKSYTIV